MEEGKILTASLLFPSEVGKFEATARIARGARVPAERWQWLGTFGSNIVVDVVSPSTMIHRLMPVPAAPVFLRMAECMSHVTRILTSGNHLASRMLDPTVPPPTAPGSAGVGMSASAVYSSANLLAANGGRSPGSTKYNALSGAAAVTDRSPVRSPSADGSSTPASSPASGAGHTANVSEIAYVVALIQACILNTQSNTPHQSQRHAIALSELLSVLPVLAASALRIRWLRLLLGLDAGSASSLLEDMGRIPADVVAAMNTPCSRERRRQRLERRIAERRRTGRPVSILHAEPEGGAGLDDEDFGSSLVLSDSLNASSDSEAGEEPPEILGIPVDSSARRRTGSTDKLLHQLQESAILMSSKDKCPSSDGDDSEHGSVFEDSPEGAESEVNPGESELRRRPAARTPRAAASLKGGLKRGLPQDEEKKASGTMTIRQRALFTIGKWASGGHWEQSDPLQSLALELFVSALQYLSPAFVHQELVVHVLQTLCMSQPTSMVRVYYARALRTLFSKGSASSNSTILYRSVQGGLTSSSADEELVVIPNLAKYVIIAIHDIVHNHLQDVSVAQHRSRNQELPSIAPSSASLTMLPCLAMPSASTPANPSSRHVGATGRGNSNVTATWRSAWSPPVPSESSPHRSPGKVHPLSPRNELTSFMDDTQSVMAPHSPARLTRASSLSGFSFAPSPPPARYYEPTAPSSPGPAFDAKLLETSRMDAGFDLQVLMGFIGDLLHESKSGGNKGEAGGKRGSSTKGRRRQASRGASGRGDEDGSGHVGYDSDSSGGASSGAEGMDPQSRGASSGCGSVLSCADCGGDCALKTSTLTAVGDSTSAHRRQQAFDARSPHDAHPYRQPSNSSAVETGEIGGQSSGNAFFGAAAMEDMGAPAPANSSALTPPPKINAAEQSSCRVGATVAKQDALMSMCPNSSRGYPSLGLWMEAARAVATASVKLSSVPDGGDGISPEYKSVLACGLQLCSACPLLREIVLRRVLRKWPSGNSDNEIALLEFLATVLATTTHRADLVVTDLRKIMLSRVLTCLTSTHIKVARNALVLVDPSRRLIDFLVDDASAMKRLLERLDTNVREHWSPLVRKASSVAHQVYVRQYEVLMGAHVSRTANAHRRRSVVATDVPEPRSRTSSRARSSRQSNGSDSSGHKSPKAADGDVQLPASSHKRRDSTDYGSRLPSTATVPTPSAAPALPPYGQRGQSSPSTAPGSMSPSPPLPAEGDIGLSFDSPPASSASRPHHQSSDTSELPAFSIDVTSLQRVKDLAPIRKPASRGSGSDESSPALVPRPTLVRTGSVSPSSRHLSPEVVPVEQKTTVASPSAPHVTVLQTAPVARGGSSDTSSVSSHGSDSTSSSSSSGHRSRSRKRGTTTQHPFVAVLEEPATGSASSTSTSAISNLPSSSGTANLSITPQNQTSSSTTDAAFGPEDRLRDGSSSSDSDSTVSVEAQGSATPLLS